MAPFFSKFYPQAAHKNYSKFHQVSMAPSLLKCLPLSVSHKELWVGMAPSNKKLTHARRKEPLYLTLCSLGQAQKAPNRGNALQPSLACYIYIYVCVCMYTYLQYICSYLFTVFIYLFLIVLPFKLFSLPSFPPCFLLPFLYSILCLSVPSFLSSFLPCFLPSFLPSFFPSFLPTFLHSSFIHSLFM